MVAWEITRSCNLACVHCRASSRRGPYHGELATEDSLRLLDEISTVGNPVVILTGGEPLLRKDIYDIAAYGNALGLRMVLATNGTLITEEMAARILKSGIKRVSVSIDGKNDRSHDDFRGVPGAFGRALAGIDALKKTGLEFQINTTITRLNRGQMADIMDMAIDIGAAAHHIFLLVPTGRGKDLIDQAISPEEYEQTLNLFYEKSLTCSIQLKATCAPHYYRILCQRGGGTKIGKQALENPFHAMTRGCLGGVSFCFISHTGQVQPCGYLELNCGRIGEKTFVEIWKQSTVFHKLRDLKTYKGKCGRCEFISVCGGCRARAYEFTGDYLAEEPFCVYEPRKNRGEQQWTTPTKKS